MEDSMEELIDSSEFFTEDSVLGVGSHSTPKKKRPKKEWEKDCAIIGSIGPVKIIRFDDSSGYYECVGRPQKVEFSFLADNGKALAEILGVPLCSGKVTFDSAVFFKCEVKNDACQIKEVAEIPSEEHPYDPDGNITSGFSKASVVKVSWEDGTIFSGHIREPHVTKGTIIAPNVIYHYVGLIGKDGRPQGSGRIRKVLERKSTSTVLFGGLCQNGEPNGKGSILIKEDSGEGHDYPCYFLNGVKIWSAEPKESLSNNVEIKSSEPEESLSNNVEIKSSEPEESLSNNVEIKSSEPEESLSNNVEIKSSEPEESLSNDVETKSSGLMGRIAYVIHCAHCLARFMGRLLCLGCLRAGKEIDDDSGLGQSSNGKVKRKGY
ncbi:MAG: hypothetical protein LBU15_01530 [Rickettsiales bacterium]|jgi:hypothetical protein|nr:hypothetical protein [Rickettsiales bacterium]